MGINTFSVVLNQYVSSGNNYIVELSGLARRAPVIAITLSLALLSIAGVPPLAGFYSKYNVVMALLEEGWLVASAIAIIISVIGAYYYIRLIQLMFFNDSVPYLSKQIGDLVLPAKSIAMDS
jgi:NADH-quinone oxidoreductase subunit N